MTFLNRFLLGVMTLLWMITTAQAQDVTLTSRDQSIELTGTLLGFDGEFYRVDTVYGELTVDGSGVLCSGSGCPSLEAFVSELTLSGSASMGRVLMPALIEGYARRAGLQARRIDLSPRIVQYELISPESEDLVGRFTLNLTTSNEGFADLLTDEADIAMSRRLIWPSELALAQSAELGDLTGAHQQKVLALDALAAVVSPETKLSGMTIPQIASLADGSLENWALLTGQEAPLFFDPPSGDEVQSFEDQIRRIGMTLNISGQGSLIADVRENPLTIALMNVSEVSDGLRALPILGGCGTVMLPSPQNIRAGDYPLTAPMTLYRPVRRLSKVAREFWDYLDTPSAQRVVKRAGFIDQLITETRLEAQGDRLTTAIRVATPESFAAMQEAIEFLNGRRRLNLTFRYEAGGLDAQSLGNLDRLAQMIDRGDLDGRTILVAGFADPSDDAATTLQAAESIRQAVLDRVQTDGSKVEISVAGLGSTMPIACPEDAWGQTINRRVEVWLR